MCQHLDNSFIYTKLYCLISKLNYAVGVVIPDCNSRFLTWKETLQHFQNISDIKSNFTVFFPLQSLTKRRSHQLNYCQLHTGAQRGKRRSSPTEISKCIVLFLLRVVCFTLPEQEFTKLSVSCCFTSHAEWPFCLFVCEQDISKTNFFKGTRKKVFLFIYYSIS